MSLENNTLNQYTQTQYPSDNTNLEDINQKLDYIITKLNIFEQKLDSINNSSKNMDDHISFVENVYNIVKNPFQSILTYYYKKDTPALPNERNKLLEN